MAGMLGLLTGACGGGGSSGSTAPDPLLAPQIAVQPGNASVPMGIAATFSVSATGPSLQYQWMRNGMQIAGATASSYQTPPTTFNDGGASFSVSVSNPDGSITSANALLTVTARAPQSGDLRFQQVDAATTVNGYGGLGGISSDLLFATDSSYGPALGTPFYVGAGNCGPVESPPEPGACAWFYSTTFLAAGPVAGYASDDYANFAQDFTVPSLWIPFGNDLQPVASQSVITSLDVEAANGVFAVSWQQAPAGAFDLAVHSVASADFAAAAAAEGAAGRVITAVSDDNGQLTYLSYGWQQDTATVYETSIVTATPAAAPAAAATLAAGGYLITANGVADANGDVLFVGTRVSGDTLPRPFVAAQGDQQVSTMEQQGYANVAVIVNLAATNPYTYLGER